MIRSIVPKDKADLDALYYITVANVASRLERGAQVYISGDKTASGNIDYELPLSFWDIRNPNGFFGLEFVDYTTGLVIATDENLKIEITYENIYSLPPSNLMPVIVQNPRGAINFSWWHTPNPGLFAEDPQIGWELTIWQDGITPIVQTGTTENAYTLPANTFTEYNSVYFKVRTQTQHNGWGEYAQSSFVLGLTPPNPPTLVSPPNGTTRRADIGVGLDWVYSSPHDTQWSKFDYRYKVNGFDWIEGETTQSSTTTNPILTESDVQWQVRAYGELGDVGEWSAIGRFRTIGKPPAPVIVNVTDSNRPIITFSQQNFLSFEISILNAQGAEIYNTKNIPFENVFFHQTTELLPNGQYIAKVRTTPKLGLYLDATDEEKSRSDWGTRPFTINQTTLIPTKLEIASNNDLHISLFLGDNAQTKYIYRNGIRIAKTTATMWNDYAASSHNRHIYQVWNVDDMWRFGISEQVAHMIKYKYTTIASVENLSDMLKLGFQIDGQPTKDMGIEQEKILSNFTGRQRPVVQFGEHLTQDINFSFFILTDDKDKLIQLANITDILCLRHFRYGTFFGDITSRINFTPESHGFIASFTFTVLDYKEEIPLD